MALTLRGIVFDKYPTIGKFAEAMGWSRNKASGIVNGKRQPSKADMEDLISEFSITPESIAPIFFGSMFTE